MKISTRFKGKTRTVIVSFHYDGDPYVSPKKYAESFYTSRGYEVESAKGHDKRMFHFMASRGPSEVRLVKSVLISQFYVTPDGRIGAQAGYHPLTPKQAELGVEFVYVSKDGHCASTKEELCEMMKDQILGAVK